MERGGSSSSSQNENMNSPNTNPTNLDLFNIIKELVTKVNSLENQVTDLKNQLSASSSSSSSTLPNNSNNSSSSTNSNNNEPKKKNKKEEKKEDKKKSKQKEDKKEKAKEKKKTKKDDKKKKSQQSSPTTPPSLPEENSIPIEIPIPSAAVLDDLTPPITEETCEVSLQAHANFEKMLEIDQIMEEANKIDGSTTEEENGMDLDSIDYYDLSDEDPERLEHAREEDLLKRKDEEECTNEDLLGISKQFPQGLLDKLYSHQKRGVKFLWENLAKGNGCVLADFMGMGKTLQTASFLHGFFAEKLAKTALIVSPASVNTHWDREFKKIENWTPNIPHIKPVLLSSKISIQERKKLTTNWHENGGVMITSYDLFRTLCVDEDFKEYLLNPGPDIIILDEGHKIRHLSSKITRALNSVNTQKRIILTGYPFQNNLLEYWTMINFVCPMYLGEKSEFKRKYSKPIQKGQLSKIPYERRIARRRSWLLYEKVKSIILRRDASLLKKLLPQKQEILLTLSNSDIQRKMYNILIESIKSLGKPSIFWTYDVVIMLCNHPDVLYNYYKWKEKQIETQKIEKEAKEPKKIEKESYSAEEETNNGEVFDPSIDDEEIESYIDKEVDIGEEGKEDQKKNNEILAKSILTEIFKCPEGMGYKRGALDNGGKMILLFSVMFQCKSVGDRLIVFSRSINTLNFIENTLKRYNKGKDTKGQLNFMRFDGSTPFDQRQICIDKINDNSNNITVLLISTLAGCEGINLMGANRVALIDVNWNPSHDSEAVCRVFRIGQLKPVYIYRFICESTMEDLVLKRQLQKENLSNWIVDNGNSSVDAYDTKNLLIIPPEDLEKEEPEVDPLINDTLILNTIKENTKWIKRADFRDQLLQDDPLNILTEEEKLLAHSENEFESVYGAKRNYERKKVETNQEQKPKPPVITVIPKKEEPINTNYLKDQESLWLRRQQILVEKETVEASKLLQYLETDIDIPLTMEKQGVSTPPPLNSGSDLRPSHSQFEKEKNNIMKQLVIKNKEKPTPKNHHTSSSSSTSFEDPYEIEMERARLQAEHQKKRPYKDVNDDSKGGYRNNRLTYPHDSRDYRDNGRSNNRDYRDTRDNHRDHRDFRDSRDNRDRSFNYRDSRDRDNRDKDNHSNNSNRDYNKDKRSNNYDSNKRYKKF